jgi:Holliday junction resolvase
VPDILGVLPDGKALMIEVKTETGKVSPEQESFIENASRVGAVAFIARSINDVMARGI